MYIVYQSAIGTVYNDTSPPYSPERLNTLLACTYYAIVPSGNQGSNLAAQRRQFSNLAHAMRQDGLQAADNRFYVDPSDRRNLRNAAHAHYQARMGFIVFSTDVTRRDAQVSDISTELSDLQSRSDNLMNILELTSILDYIRAGFNNTQDSYKFVNRLSRRMNLPIPRHKPAGVILKELRCNILHVSGLHQALTPAETRFLTHLVPIETRISNTTGRMTREGELTPLECTNTIRLNEDGQMATALSSDLIITHTYDKPLLIIHYASEQEAAEHRTTLEQIPHTSLVKRMHSSTWDAMVEVWFSTVRFVTQAVTHPEWLETDKPGYESCMRRLTQPSADWQPLKIIFWLDGWKGTTAVKIRLYDPSGFTLPNRITPPFRVMEFMKQEKDLFEPDTLGKIEKAIEALYMARVPIRNTGQVTSFDQVILLGDHPAMAKMISVKTGQAHYPSPFSSVRVTDKALRPIANTNRVTLADVVRFKKAFSELVADRHRTSDPFALYGDFHLGTDHPVIFAKTEESDRVIPLDRIVLCPPIMHDSHNLLEQVAAMCNQFKRYSLRGRD
ncbi:hypothetical protein J8273_5138 [Carpediemonas membranifera]|uniref:Uncharacterized protein n=1 Tax=Carpediemonas membranifera TaxID=201153 RepID=A0A8J6B8E4_9EUKA|nr:hypothetical protein J8273_5138 [Carpediemonas membranifera]|eukprot:KAG9392157.1 hypothetical protein J8273_5138 [Carpediemonas membranifera]